MARRRSAIRGYDSRGCRRSSRLDASGRANWFFSRLIFERLESRALLSLTHLYTFNNGTASDSVGGANGTLFNGAAIVEGWLNLQNGGGLGAKPQQRPHRAIRSTAGRHLAGQSQRHDRGLVHHLQRVARLGAGV